jgi:hypothetical protein
MCWALRLSHGKCESIRGIAAGSDGDRAGTTTLASYREHGHIGKLTTSVYSAHHVYILHMESDAVRLSLLVRARMSLIRLIFSK